LPDVRRTLRWVLLEWSEHALSGRSIISSNLRGAEGPPERDQAVLAQDQEADMDATAVDHQNNPLSPEADLFVPAPPELGQVLSASTTLKKSTRSRSPKARLQIIAIAAGFALVAPLVLVRHLKVEEFLLVGPAVAGVAALVAWLVTRFRHTLTYVGQEGLARFYCEGDRANLKEHSNFLFRDASDLRIEETERFVNGAYQGTTYSYSWTDAAGQRRYTIAGKYMRKNRPTHQIHFARAAEKAWLQHLVFGLDSRLKEQGYLQFNLGTGHALRVGPGLLEVCQKDKTERFETSAIKSLSLEKGQFRLERKDPGKGAFSGANGVFLFSYRDLSNAKLFVVCAEKFLGVCLS
jgi:hypothetical protein